MKRFLVALLGALVLLAVILLFVSVRSRALPDATTAFKALPVSRMPYLMEVVYVSCPGCSSLVTTVGGENRQVFPNDGLLLSLRRAGGISIDGNFLSFRFAKVDEFSINDISSGQNCGAFSLALDPDFSVNHFFYVAHCDHERHPTVTRFQWNDSFAVSNTATTILKLPDPVNGSAMFMIGSMVFDGQKNMLIGMGDQGIQGAAQDMRSPLGKILRLTPSRDPGTGGFLVPADNPLVGDKTANPLVYAYGLYAPWRMIRDDTGRIWITDHAPNGFYAELNILGAPLQNFGWGFRGNCATCTAPVLSWNVDTEEMAQYISGDERQMRRRIAWVGTAPTVRTGSGALGSDAGVLFGDWCTGTVKSAKIAANGQVRTSDVGNLTMLTGSTRDEIGRLLVATYSEELPSQCYFLMRDPLASTERGGRVWMFSDGR